MSQAAPGWYPQSDGQERYWDGSQWTEQFRASEAPTAAHGASAAAPTAPAYTAKQMKAAEKAGRPWYKKKRFIIPLLLLALILLATQLGKGGSDDAPKAPSSGGSSSAAASEKPAAMAGLGQSVKEGDIEFAINSWKCGTKQVGDAAFGEKAQGEFCIADVVYKNVGNESKMFNAESALTARKGEVKYKPNSMASIHLNSGNQTFLENVNPGNTVKGKVAFDVPVGTKIDTVYVVDGFTGDGTPIKVG